MMNILIVADVGLGKNGWLHVGDEAMFLRNYYELRKHHPQARLTLLSRSKSHQGLKVDEIINDFFFVRSKFRLLFFLGFILRVWLLKRFNLSLSSDLKVAIKAVSGQDAVLISGGGNLNSLFPEYLYNRTAITWLAKAFNIPVVASGQTLGPIKGWQDKMLLRFFLAKADALMLRDKNDSIRHIPTKYLSKIFFSLDDAYFLESKNVPWMESLILGDSLNIGLSLRDWDSQDVYKTVKTALIQLRKLLKGNIRLFLIPHIIDQNDNGDLSIMCQHFGSLEGFEVKSLDYQLLSSYDFQPEEIIHLVTGKIDLVISSRYHGVVFALSQNVPVIGVFENEYYRRKVVGVYENLGLNTNEYSVDISHPQSQPRLNSLVSEFAQMKDTITQKNQEVSQKRKDFINLFNEKTEGV